MKKSLRIISIKKVAQIFNSYSNFPQLFEDLPFSRKKIPITFLKNGTPTKEALTDFFSNNDFIEKFIINATDDKFIFNELVSDDFTVLSSNNSFFNVKILESFNLYTFSKSLLCEKENKNFPALIISHIGDDFYWFIIE